MKKHIIQGKSVLGTSLAVVLLATSIMGCSNGSDQQASTTDTQESQDTTQSQEQATTETETSTEAATETTVIKYGTHWVAGLDPNNVDEVTGEYTMAETERQAALAALDAVKSELNVEFEFVQYSSDVRTELMTSVLAGDPVCDLATIWGGAEGTILAQNVLQELDDYADIFADEEVSWMFDDKLYGHNYLLSFTERFIPRWPLIYNATMIEAVDSLKDEDGNTVYPTDLFENGEWTWSAFEDYLSKIEAYYANVPSAEGSTQSTVQAYETDHRFAGLSAIYSNGGAIYGANGLSVDSDETKEGLAFISELMDLGVMSDPGVYDDGYTPQWTTAQGDFSRSATVFTDCPDWLIASAVSAVAERNESVGIVPWPRPDDLDADDEAYQQVITLGDSVGVLKGVDEEKTKLALEAYKLYWATYYKTLGGVDDLTQYQSSMAASQAAGYGFDIYNETYGEDVLNAFIYISENLSNDYADLLNLRVSWDDVLGKSLYGLEGMADYSVAIEENMNLFENQINNMEAILSSDEVHDNMGPDLTGTDIEIPAGTDINSVDFTEYFTATDTVDGELDLATATFTVSDELDTDTPGVYSSAVKMEIADSSENSSSKSVKVIVYDADNTEAPTVVLKEETDSIALDTDASSIDWSAFIESATDADGLDVSKKITADISTLDTSTPGEYSVDITVTDFAGNETTETITVTVAAAE